MLGFFPFHARNLLLCPPAPCAIPVYVLGEQAWCPTALPTLPGCLGSSALCKGKYCLLPTQPLLQLMRSWERCYILAGEVNQPEKQAELMDIQIIANVFECFIQQRGTFAVWHLSCLIWGISVIKCLTEKAQGDRVVTASYSSPFFLQLSAAGAEFTVASVPIYSGTEAVKTNGG